MKGKLIVIDGIDGSGKATQVALLVQRLQKEGKKVRTLDFPQYKKNLFGKLIGECLQGERGDFMTLDARIASVLYAVDRFESKQKVIKWLKQGCIVILDRYVSSNQIHQGGKIPNNQKRKDFLLWLERVEYGVFGLSRADRTVFLDVPISIAWNLTQEKERDISECNKLYQERSHQSARWLAKRYGWVTIQCVQKGKLRSIEEISEEIYTSIFKS